jgi:hypothetical protein
MSVHFWPHTQNPNTASYRLRCLRVMQGLQHCGVISRLYSDGDVPENLVLSKRYDPLSIQKALELKTNLGTKLYLDICDNHFYFKTPEPDAINRADQLRSAVKSVDVVIASSEYLAEVVRNESGNCTPVVVIGDLVEFPHEAGLLEKIRYSIPFLRLKILEFAINKLGPVKSRRFVWFGNHGGGYADGGMNDLQTIRTYLEDAHREAPVSLTIISNSRGKYKKLTEGWKVPVFYIPWNKTFFSVALRLHGISVIPIQKNPFTMAKTNNRVATSLIHGLRVIADEIPSYAYYKEFIIMNEWKNAFLMPAMLTPPHRNVFNVEYFREENEKIIGAWASIFSDAVLYAD